nr:hypothetical protein [Motilibacter deserti]
MGAGAVRTVTGDLAPSELGVCDAHDHLFLRTPLLPGQELTDVRAAQRELDSWRAAGGHSLVQWTPAGLGRGADHLRSLSTASGVHVVAATGLHRAAHYLPQRLAQALDGLAELFVRELTVGIAETGVRAGLIKVAGAFHQVDEHARVVLAAAADAHHASDAPIAVHPEAGTAAADVLDVLCGRHGVPARRVVLGHLGRRPDIASIVEVARSGAFLSLDGPSRANAATDWQLPAVLRALVDAGHAAQILLGGDTTSAAARSRADGPGPAHLLRTIRPQIARAHDEPVARAVFVENPARAFAACWP